MVIASLASAFAGCAIGFDFEVDGTVDTALPDTADTTDTSEPDATDATDVDDEEPACEDACEADASGCADGALLTCVEDADGCLVWSDPIDCGQGTCTDDVCVCDDGEDPVDGVCAALVDPGGACACDGECAPMGTADGVCVGGVCMLATEGDCDDDCDEGFACENFTVDLETLSACAPLCTDFACDGGCDADGVCLPNLATVDGCDWTCSTGCERPPCACETGDVRCGDDGGVQTCEGGDDVTCPDWSDEVACETNAVCVDGACGCPDACTVGDRSCIDDADYTECQQDPDLACPEAVALSCSDTDNQRFCVTDTGLCECTPSVGVTCDEATGELWVVDGCGERETLQHTCLWGCDVADATCWDAPEWVPVAPGTFIMGSPEGDDAEPGRGAETQHEVTLTRSFAIGATEVTQATYRALMGDNPSEHADCPTCPVESVSWEQALSFCNALSAREGLESCYTARDLEWDFAGLDCTGYRLPTEAEWEFAARAGTTTAYYFGADDSELATYGYYRANADGPQPVSGLAPNDLGLYDTSGNVWEWVWDGYWVYPTGDTTDPLGDDTREYRACRGGSWSDLSHELRSANRGAERPTFADSTHGFRVARTLADTDTDTVEDAVDNCPDTPNLDQADRDGDLVGDACDICPDDPLNDSDGDEVCDSVDICPVGDDRVDTDEDGVPDACDLCPGAPDSDDRDVDGVPDDCDPCPDDNPDDTDMDGVCDSRDDCPEDPGKVEPGVCGCGTPDVDSDIDGTADCNDRCPFDPTDSCAAE